jgi:hypothetical protein
MRKGQLGLVDEGKSGAEEVEEVRKEIKHENGELLFCLLIPSIIEVIFGVGRDWTFVATVDRSSNHC